MALFTIAKTWMQPKCSPTDKWIKMMWCVYIYTYIYIYTHTHTHTQTYIGILLSRKNENVITPFAASCVDLEVIILKKVS